VADAEPSRRTASRRVIIYVLPLVTACDFCGNSEM
jgi:hypothetical protein